MYGIPLRLIGIGVAVLAVLAGLWGYGHHKYELGVTDERARWTPQLIAAEKALAVANEKTLSVERASDAVTHSQEARHAETIADLNARAADADSRFRALSVRLRTASATCRGELPAVPGTASEPDAATAGDAGAAEIGSAFAEVGRDCEADSATLADLQHWAREQATLMGVRTETGASP